MAWYDDEANEDAQNEATDADRKKIVAQSNYWARLVQQVREDVAGINKTPNWQSKLEGFPLRFDPIFGGDGYQVVKSGSLPNAVVVFQQHWDHVLIARQFTEIETTLSKEFFAQGKVAHWNAGQFGDSDQQRTRDPVRRAGRGFTLHPEGNNRISQTHGEVLIRSRNLGPPLTPLPLF